MKKKLFRVIRTALCFALIVGLCIAPASSVRAEDLYGRVNLSYDPASGELTAKYIGSAELSKDAVYKWYRAGSEVQNGKSSTYTPTEKGKYTVVLTDGNYEGTLESNTVMLYKVSSSTELSYNSPNALYKAGNSVRASRNTTYDEVINEWSCDITGLDLTSRNNYVSFTMPATDVNLFCDSGAIYQVKIYGGTSETYTAQEGDVFTIRASSIDGKTFLGWKSNGGGTFDSAISPVTQFRMPANNVSIVGTFVENSVVDAVTRSTSSSARRSSSSSMRSPSSSMYGYGSGSSSSRWGSFGSGANVRIADPLHTVYEVLWSNNYKVDMFHANQGILCDLQFKSALKGDTLVLDYFNLVINNNYEIRETPTPITIRLTIPMDLQWPGRNWRMICVGRNGEVFSFPDEDIDDETITFSPDRFYAFAMAYNDNPPVEESEVASDSGTVSDNSVEGYMEFSDEDIDKILKEDEPSSDTGAISQAHSSTESQSSITDTDTQSAEHFNGLPQGGNNSSASQISTPVNISSDKSAAIIKSRGTRVSEINL